MVEGSFPHLSSQKELASVVIESRFFESSQSRVTEFEFERVRVSALGKFSSLNNTCSSSSQKSSQDFYSGFAKYSVKAEN